MIVHSFSNSSKNQWLRNTAASITPRSCPDKPSQLCDDVLDQRFGRFQEVVAPCPVASVDQIRGHHLLSGLSQYLGNGPVAAGWFPD
jgi:hypothetical protein